MKTKKIRFIDKMIVEEQGNIDLLKNIIVDKQNKINKLLKIKETLEKCQKK